MIRTVYKLRLKHWVRYRGRLVVGLVDIMIWGIIFIFFAEAFASSKEVAKGFGLTATMLLTFISSAMWDVANFFRSEEYYGTFYRIFATPANRILMILGVSFASFTFVIMNVMILIGLGRIIGVKIIPGISFRISVLAVRISIFGFAMLVAPIGIAVKQLSGPLINLLNTIIYLISGALIPLSVLPGIIQKIAYAFPFTKAFEAFRGATVYGRSTAAVINASLRPILEGIVFMLISSYIIKLSELWAMEYGYERI